MFAKTTITTFLPLTLLLAAALALTGCNGPKKAPAAAPKAEAPKAEATKAAAEEPKAEAAPAQAPAAEGAAKPAEGEAAAEPAAEAPATEGAAKPTDEATPEAPAAEVAAEGASPEAAPAQPATVEPEALDPMTNPAELSKRLEAIQKAAVHELEIARANAASLGERKGLLELRRKELAESGFADVCPMGDDLTGLRKRILFVADQFGYTVENYRVVESPVQRPPVPDELPAGKEGDVEDMDFVKPLLVTFILQGESKDKLGNWLETLKKEPRVVKVQRIKNPEQSGWLVNLEAYGLRTDQYPVLKSMPIDFKVVLKRNGIHLDMDELVRRDPVGKAHGAAMAYKEYNDLINNVNAANIVQSELRWVEAKLRWLKAVREAAAKVDIKAFPIR
jgi:hypothetical protein